MVVLGVSIPFVATLLLSSLMLVGFASAQEPASAGDQDTEGALRADTSGAETTPRYGRHGSMRAQPGRREEVIGILLNASEVLSSEGCLVYAVGSDPDEADLIWVTEIWESKEAHAASIELPAVREAIEKAMPMLTGEFTGSEFDVLGGLGLP